MKDGGADVHTYTSTSRKIHAHQDTYTLIQRQAHTKTHNHAYIHTELITVRNMCVVYIYAR